MQYGWTQSVGEMALSRGESEAGGMDADSRNPSGLSAAVKSATLELPVGHFQAGIFVNGAASKRMPVTFLLIFFFYHLDVPPRPGRPPLLSSSLPFRRPAAEI